MDQDNNEYAKEQLDKEVSNANYVELLDYTTMYDQMESGEVDAMIISNTSIGLLEEQYEGLQRQHPYDHDI